MTKGLKIPKDTKKDKHCNDQRFEDIKGYEEGQTLQ
jgi:hypothetical protein